MPDELSERLGARTVSRLVEICGDLIPLYGEDRRREFRTEPERHRRTGRLTPAQAHGQRATADPS